MKGSTKSISAVNEILQSFRQANKQIHPPIDLENFFYQYFGKKFSEHRFLLLSFTFRKGIKYHGRPKVLHKGPQTSS
jgi:hypothetical protein